VDEMIPLVAKALLKLLFTINDNESCRTILLMNQTAIEKLIVSYRSSVDKDATISSQNTYFTYGLSVVGYNFAV